MTLGPFDNEEVLFARKQLRVVCVGAGMSGLYLAHKLQVEHRATTDYEGGWVDFQIYEKNPKVGGTWYENTYPGVACDVPAHVYAFSFETNPEYTQYFADGAEIQAYVERITRKYDLDRHVQLDSRVVESVWDDERSVWNIKVQRADGTVVSDCCDVLINGSGILNKWKWPDVKGLHEFQGPLLHSANWDHSVDLENKTMLLIGNGSSAIQILPEIQKKAKHVYNVIRNPTWIQPRSGIDLRDENRRYSPEDIEYYRRHPEEIEKFQKTVLDDFDHFTYCMLRMGPGQKDIQEEYTQVMKERLHNKPELVERFVPKYNTGCRRLTPGFGYLEALQKPNVEPLFTSIKEINSTGVVVSDPENGERQLDVDVLVCATGFDVSFNPYWPIHGTQGISLSEQWKEVPKAYLSVTAPNMPNYFIYNGPNFPASHGSVPLALSIETEHFYKWLDKISKDRIRTIMPKEDIVEQSWEFFQHRLQQSVFASNCTSWYKKAEDQGSIITAMYPGTMKHFEKLLENIRPEDYNISYDHPQNIFYFFGSGRTADETAVPNPYMHEKEPPVTAIANGAAKAHTSP